MFERVRYRTDPDWYEYRLTERALDLYPAIVALMRWADRHMAPDEDAIAVELVHRTCGEPDRIPTWPARTATSRWPARDIVATRVGPPRGRPDTSCSAVIRAVVGAVAVMVVPWWRPRSSAAVVGRRGRAGRRRDRRRGRG